MATVPIGNRNIGDIIRITVNNAAREFIVVHKGRPSAMYDASFDNGVIVLMRDLWENRQWHSPDNTDYANSTLHAWLNNQFLNLIAENIRNQIVQVRIPFRPGSGMSTTVNSGASGLQCRVFIPSMLEIGATASGATPADGTKFDYFLLGNASSGDGLLARQRRIATLAGSAADWWLRSPQAASEGHVWRVSADGNLGTNFSSVLRGVRPALVLPSNLLVSDDGSVVTALPPTMPANLNVPATILGGSNVNISWSASTDPNTPAQAVSYRLDRATNGGGFVNIFEGTALSFNDTIASGTTSVQYRVRAFNTSGLESANNTGAVINVINNSPPSIDGADGSLGAQSAAFTQNYVVTDPDAGDTLTVTETLNGTLIRQYNPTSGAPQTLTVTPNMFLGLGSGTHTLVVTARDQHNATATRTWTFTRDASQTNQIQVQFENPLPADDMPTRIIVNVGRSIPTGASFQVQVCNNGNDASPTWEDCTNAVLMNIVYTFSNTTKTAADWGVNIRVNVNRNSAVGLCYISSIGGNFE